MRLLGGVRVCLDADHFVGLEFFVLATHCLIQVTRHAHCLVVSLRDFTVVRRERLQFLRADAQTVGQFVRQLALQVLVAYDSRRLVNWYILLLLLRVGGLTLHQEVLHVHVLL